jgi:hypothetical protein
MALDKFKVAPLPNPPGQWDAQYMRQVIRVLETYFSQLDSSTPNNAQQYTADLFVGGVLGAGSVTTTERNALTPAEGWLVFDTTVNKLSFYNGSAWEYVSTGSGGGGYTVVTRNVSYTETATSGDLVVLVTGAAVTVTLPTAVGNTAKLTFKLTVAGTMTLDGAGAETIDGAATAVTSVQYTAFTLISDNANWYII